MLQFKKNPDGSLNHTIITNNNLQKPVEIGLNDTGLISIKNNTTSLNLILTELVVSLSVFSAAIAISDPMTSVAAGTLVTSLTKVQSDISSLFI